MRNGQVPYLTDDALFRACGVRIAFTGREGGISAGPFSSLNLSTYVGDSLDTVVQNRLRVLDALGGKGSAIIVPKQVHGANIETLSGCGECALRSTRSAAEAGADGVIVDVDNVAALLGFADCVPIIMASPSAAFAVVHAGWRGVMQDIAPKALRMLAAMPIGALASSRVARIAESEINIYIGPHIHRECFETSADVHALFVEKFGEDVAYDNAHIDLNAALRKSLVQAGADPNRIADADICTVCDSDRFFSYRASGGTCGRHGAIAFRNPAALADSADANSASIDEADNVSTNII